MLGFPSDIKHEARCNVTHGIMGHLDPSQPPMKRKPFAAILSHNFVKKIELVLPEEIYGVIQDNFFPYLTTPSYSRVILPLKALVEGDFFNEYIKKGNILMLSEGNIGIDNVYSLKDGILTLHLDKESYERAGLVGIPEGVKGKRGTKPRWVVEINFRLPSMLHGKKGFDRIVYAFKNVLNNPVTWLFQDLGIKALTPDPLDIHIPTKKIVTPQVRQNINVNMPSLKPPLEIDVIYGGDFEDYAIETHEWLSLVLLDSPRINPNDKIDPIISRYTPPGDSLLSCKLVKVTWEGFLTSSWAHKAFVQLLLALPEHMWFAFYVAGFGDGPLGENKDCMTLKLPDTPNEYMLWEIA